MASFFLSKELHFESRQPLIVFPSSTGNKPKETYTTVYQRSATDFSYDVDDQNEEHSMRGDCHTQNRVHDDRNTGVTVSSSHSTAIPISDRIDSRKPFSADSSSSSQQTHSTSAFSLHNSMYYNHDMLDSPSPHDSHRLDGDGGEPARNILSMSISSPSSCSTPDWADRIKQFNPFYSSHSRDKYERVPEP